MLHMLRLISKKKYQKKQIKLIKKSLQFDEKWYLKQYPDIKDSNLNSIEHYVCYGWKEGRNPNPHFNTNSYLNQYPRLINGKTCPLYHAILNKKKNVPDTPPSVTFPPNAKEIIKEFKINTEKGRTVIFAVFTQNGKIPDTTIYMLNGLKKIAKNIILVADNPIFEEEINKIKDIVCYCSFTRNNEYDFGSYKRGFLYAKEKGILDNSTSLTLCNDSCYGPVFPFEPIFNTMEQKNIDFWGMVANDEFRYHLQSYFLVFNPVVFKSDVFEAFIKSIKQEKTVQDVILKYETHFTETLKNAGFTCESYIKHEENTNTFPRCFHSNLTVFPVFLLKHGCPLVKVKALKSPLCNFEDIENTLTHIALYNKELAQQLSYPQKTTKKVAFSIILPTHNRKKMIDNAIASVLNQYYQNFELIIVDDGSTDNTQEHIQQKYAQEISAGKIKYIYKKNEGVCKARNIALATAKNEWICYLDSDNTLAPYFLTFFAKHINLYKNKVFYSKYYSQKSKKILGLPFKFKNLIKGNYIDLGSFVHHKSLYTSLGGFDEKMTRLVDWDLIVRYTKKHKPFYIQNCLFLYNDFDTHERISNQICFKDNLDYFKKKHKKLF